MRSSTTASLLPILFETGVGSDVPALLRGGPVRVGGRGEVVEPADSDPSWWVLLSQPFGVATGDAYRWWDEDGGPSSPHAGSLVNDLEGPVARRHPEVSEAKAALLAAGAEIALMCGSGPTVAGRVRSEAEARRIAQKSLGATGRPQASGHHELAPLRQKG